MGRWRLGQKGEGVRRGRMWKGEKGEGKGEGAGV